MPDRHGTYIKAAEAQMPRFHSQKYLQREGEREQVPVPESRSKADKDTQVTDEKVGQ